MPSCLVAGSDATSVSTSHQLLSLSHCHGRGVQYFLIGVMCPPGTLSSPKDCLANSRWQPAHLTTTDGPTEADFLAGLPTATSAVLQTSLMSVQVTVLFQRLLREAFPVTAEDRTSLSAQWRLCISSRHQLSPWLSLRDVRLESREQPDPDHSTARDALSSLEQVIHSLSL